MAIELSTHHLPPARRFEYWREVITDRFLPLEPHRCGNRPFSGALTLSRLGSLPLTTIEVQGQRVTQTCSVDPEGGVVFLNLQATGSSFVRQGGDRLIRPGSGFLVEASSPFELHCPELMTHVCVSIPRAQLTDRLHGRPTSLAGVELSPARPAERLCLEFLLDTARGRGRWLVDEAPVQTHLLDLLAYALNRRSAAAPLPRHAREVAIYLRARRTIESAFTDPGLNASSLSRRFGMSLRSLQRLFRRHGRTRPGDAIVAERLDAACRRLADRTWRHRSIAEIAHASGFADLSYFCRRFKGFTGRSPRQYRRDCG